MGGGRIDPEHANEVENDPEHPQEASQGVAITTTVAECGEQRGCHHGNPFKILAEVDTLC